MQIEGDEERAGAGHHISVPGRRLRHAPPQ
jgi:hypothetical protein